ncbi:hypothetical protein AAFF_G00311580 [Aldrovandia affinis]|uniref:MICOS complex subunit n=1 Tax=Aldrovandia affinis TaxID=143900 RepID=A0AAD7SNA2_9TELE|nr:hypothetical protein AAFF_G00311580 [Aldrovandia affinis]
MAGKVAKLVAIPAAMGLASIRVYAMSEEKTEELLSPEELSIYAPPTQHLRYVEEQPGLLQRGFGGVRVGLQPYVRAIKGAYTSVKVGVVTVYHAGQDTYHFLRDPPPGFLPRVGVITVSGLAGLILARKGSRLKKVGVPLGLATVGTAVCYPSQTVGLLKLTGKKTYAATQWTTSSVASLWKRSPAKEAVAPSAGPEAVPVPVTEPEPVPEPAPIEETAPPEHIASESQPEDTPAPTPEDSLTEELAPSPIEETAPVEETEQEAPLQSPAAAPALAPIEEPSLLPLPAESTSPEPIAVISEKLGFTPDPKLMDHGQASPEDADLYSTRG